MKKSTKKADPEHRDICERLERLTGGCLMFKFYPKDFLVDDPQSEGHLYSGWLSAEMDGDVLDLDDREDMEEQIVKQLKAIGEFYEDLAKMVDDRIDLDCGERVRSGRKVVTIN